MKTYLRTLLAILGMVACQLFLTPFIVAQDAALISFKIEDQFGTVHTNEDYLAGIVIVIGSDKNGSKYNGMWAKAIRDSLRQENDFSQIKFLRIADLRGVPFFLKGFVKGKFPKERERWVLMDWKGKFAKAYEFESGACNIVIVDRNGAVVHKTSGHDLDHEKLAMICEKLKALMKG